MEFGEEFLFSLPDYYKCCQQKKAENSCLIVGTMVMTVLAACASAVIFCLSVNEAVAIDRLSSYLTLGPLALGVIMMILAFVEALIAITTSALCCGFVCNKLSSMTPIPIYIVGNQSDTFQSNYPGMVLTPGQTITWGEQSSSQITFYPYPQVSVNSGLSNTPPPSYESSKMNCLDIQNSHA